MTPRRQREILREAITNMRASAHTLIDAELFGSLDEVARTITTLERHYKELPRGRKEAA